MAGRGLGDLREMGCRATMVRNCRVAISLQEQAGRAIPEKASRPGGEGFAPRRASRPGEGFAPQTLLVSMFYPCNLTTRRTHERWYVVSNNTFLNAYATVGYETPHQVAQALLHRPLPRVQSCPCLGQDPGVPEPARPQTKKSKRRAQKRMEIREKNVPTPNDAGIPCPGCAEECWTGGDPSGQSEGPCSECGQMFPPPRMFSCLMCGSHVCVDCVDEGGLVPQPKAQPSR